MNRSNAKACFVKFFQLKGGGWYVNGYSDVSDKGKNWAKNYKTVNVPSNSKCEDGGLMKKSVDPQKIKFKFIKSASFPLRDFHVFKELQILHLLVYWGDNCQLDVSTGNRNRKVLFKH